jgi:hypothetical protein
MEQVLLVWTSAFSPNQISDESGEQYKYSWQWGAVLDQAQICTRCSCGN